LHEGNIAIPVHPQDPYILIAKPQKRHNADDNGIRASKLRVARRLNTGRHVNDADKSLHIYERNQLTLDIENVRANLKQPELHA